MKIIIMLACALCASLVCSCKNVETEYVDRIVEKESENSESKVIEKQYVASPAFSAKNADREHVLITITCETESATIYYTTDGTAPSQESIKYTSPLTITKDTVFKAIAVKDGFEDSPVSFAHYSVTNLDAIYHVEYHLNGIAAECPADARNYVSGDTLLITDTIPTSDDMKFIGWALASEGSGTIYTAGDALAFDDKNIVLYAKWIAKEIEFTFSNKDNSRVYNANYASIAASALQAYVGMTGKFKITTTAASVNVGCGVTVTYGDYEKTFSQGSCYSATFTTASMKIEDDVALKMKTNYSDGYIKKVIFVLD